ncbi:cytochrome P450 family protein [Streptantibioticus silvisoli]|uniref:Cytochrome P450 n=1 Tax=Streptantibioticus silvisoli TaxID=2705255 RepID=A0ABT6VTD8_9ACTN|nr:cytochrome P450 [Streptantibioticus silvisoli]MDI5961324.1 cytochrome P450 [Streptantibioticus silvisoli]
MTDILPSEFFTDPGPSPHAATTELRSRCPVHRINIPPGAEAYAVLGNKVVEEAFGDPRLSKQVENLPAQYRDKATASSLLVVGNLGFADPPKHSRLKKPISKAFLPGTVARLRPRIQDIVDDLIDAFPESGEIDLLSAFALPLPLIAICEYLGIPVEDRPLFQEWSYVLSQDPLQHAESELKAASEEFADYFTKLVAERRNDLRDDLLSELIRARDEEVFSERELLSTILLLIIAGHKTVANMVGNGTTLLLLHPEQLATLRTTPELIPSAIEEILRYEGSAAWASLRVAAQDMRLGGVDIPKGSFVHLSLSGAGHDPEVYDDPERFDITRSPNRHLSFGHGAHFCIGAPLARLQGEIAFSTLLRRLPRFELAVPPEEIAWIADSSLSRGLEALPVRLDGRLPR